MAKEKFEDRVLTGGIRVACKYDDGSVRYWEDDKETIVSRIRNIVAEYDRLGYKLSLRQLHYQFVTRNWIVNHDTAYKKLGSILDDCRYAGIIDWEAIEDRGRTPFIPYSADDLADGLTDLKNQYRINRQEGQKNYVELWTEKDALSGILRRSTSKYHIQLVVNKGYTSSSAIYEAYSRIAENILEGRRVVILYFGDHDPSGLDMIRDITDRLTLFLSHGDKMFGDEVFMGKVRDFIFDNGWEPHELIEHGYANQKKLEKFIKDPDNDEGQIEYITSHIRCFLDKEHFFEVRPIGLTMEQIEEYDLPPNPAKVTDPRAKAYVEKFGRISWEVDALRPEVLSSIVEENIEMVIDMELYQEVMDREEVDLEQLQGIIDSI